MPKLLDPQQVSAFHRDGFVAPIAVMSLQETAAYRRRFEDYERAHDGWYTLSKGQKIHLLQTWVAELVRGEDRCGHFIHEMPPRHDMDADALEEHARIMRLRQDILYDGVAGKPAHVENRT